MAAEMTRRGSFQVDPHDSASDVTTLSDEVAEVLFGNLALALELNLLLALVE